MVKPYFECEYKNSFGAELLIEGKNVKVKKYPECSASLNIFNAKTDGKGRLNKETELAIKQGITKIISEKPTRRVEGKKPDLGFYELKIDLNFYAPADDPLEIEKAYDKSAELAQKRKRTLDWVLPLISGGLGGVAITGFLEQESYESAAAKLGCGVAGVLVGYCSVVYSNKTAYVMHLPVKGNCS